MEIEFIQRVIKTSLVVALLIFGILSSSSHFFEGLGLLLGTIWGCINLFLIKQIMQEWLRLDKSNQLKVYVLTGMKFPILYALGYGILKIEVLPILSLVIGFSLIFGVLFLKSLAIGLIDILDHLRNF